jgi:DNA repair exonuclease SbcCD ATPase subunit
MLQSERNRTLQEKDILEEKYQSLCQENQALQGKIEDLTAEKDDVLGRMKYMRQELDDKRRDRADTSMRAEIEQLTSEVYVQYNTLSVYPGSHGKPAREAKRTLQLQRRNLRSRDLSYLTLLIVYVQSSCLFTLLISSTD